MSRAQFGDAYPLYALGVLEGPERAALEAHLASGCAECRDGIAAARGAVASRALAAPPAAPPGSTRERLVARVGRERGDAAETDDVAPVERRLPPRLPRDPSRLLAPLALATAAAALLFVGYGAWRDRRRLEASERTVALLARPDTPTIDLRGAGGDRAGPAVARAVYDAERREILVFAHGILRPAPGSVHVLWLLPTTGAPRNLGAFREDATRGAAAVATGAPPFREIAGIAVSEEADPSVSTPTKVVAAS